jgi:hypothetical protein
MERKEFFINLHKQLAKKYHLLPFDIEVIRSRYSRFPNRKSVAYWITTKLTRPLGEERKSRNLRILAFVAKCTDEQWNDINQKTEFDEGRGTDYPSTHESGVAHNAVRSTATEGDN